MQRKITSIVDNLLYSIADLTYTIFYKKEFNLENYKKIVKDKKNISLKNLDDAGLSIDSIDHHGRSLVHFAALNNDYSLVPELVLNEMNIAKKDQEGNTPLALAVKEANVQFIFILLQHLKPQQFAAENIPALLKISEAREDKQIPLLFEKALNKLSLSEPQDCERSLGHNSR